MNKAKVFIGSSVEGLPIAYAVQQNLTNDAEITVWTQGVFEISQTSIESLVSVLEKSDFAIFIFSPDDIVKIRKKAFLTVRDNVVFELGMFIGKLGRNRTFVIMPNKPAFHIPTDLLGITAGKYDSERSDGSFLAATGPVCHQIRIQITKLGLLNFISNDASAEKDIAEPDENEKVKHNDWWSYYIDKNYEKAIELITKEIDRVGEVNQKETLIYWKIYIDYKINPKNGKEAINKKLQDESANNYTYTAITRILLWEDELDFVESIIDAGLTKFGDDEILISRKAEYLEKIGKIEEAISFIKEKIDAENEALSLKLADLYESLDDKKTEEAFLVIKGAYLKNPSSKELGYKLARISIDTKKNNLALYLLDKLTKKDTNNVTYWGYLGNICVELELTNKAMISYKKADECTSSKESWILSNIGNLLKNQGLYSEARIYFNQALALEPNSEYCFNRVGNIIKSEEEENVKYNKLIKEGLRLLTESD